VAIATLGTGLVLRFGFTYLHEGRGLPIETAVSLVAVPAIVRMAVVGRPGPSSTGSAPDRSSSPP
jgi:hypothetical protein